MNIVEWIATIISIGGSYWIGNADRRHRHIGFAVLFASNVLWVVWGVRRHAWGLTTMQAAYLALNIRGFWHTVGLGDPAKARGQTHPA